MELPVNLRIRKFSHLVLVAISMLMFSGVAIAQFQPTAEQMRMINQLPPAQRQQALNALQNLQSQGQVSPGLTAITEQAPQSLLTRPAPVSDQGNLSKSLRAAARSRIVVTFTPKPMLSPGDAIDVGDDPVLSRLRGSHHFTLDDSGVLSLMGLQSVPVLGLP